MPQPDFAIKQSQVSRHPPERVPGHAHPRFCCQMLAVAICTLLAACVTHRDSQAPAGNAGNTQAVVTSDLQRREDQIEQIQLSLLPPLSQLPTPAAIAGGQTRFDLSVNNAPAKQVFEAIVSGSGYSLMVHPEIAGVISLELGNVTVTEALQAIRELYGYEFRLEGGRIYVLPAALQTRVFNVSYVTGERLGLSQTEVVSAYQDVALPGPNKPRGSQTAASGLAGRSPLQSGVVTTTRSDFWSGLGSTLKSMLGEAPGRSVVVNALAGVVVVRAMPAELRQVEHYLEAVRDSVRRQVILEARFVEVTLSERFRNGVNWEFFRRYLQAGQGIGGTLSGMSFHTRDFDAVLELLAQQGDVKVIASPRISALNNQKAVLKTGSDEFFVTGINTSSQSRTGAGSANALPDIAVRPFFAGVALDVTPQIDADSSVILHLHPSVSAVSLSERTLNLGAAIGPVTLPLARSTVSQTDSVVRSDEGQIIAIGGLMSVAISDPAAVRPGSTGQTRLVGPSLVLVPEGARKELVILIRSTVVPVGGVSVGPLGSQGGPAGVAPRGAN